MYLKESVLSSATSLFKGPPWLGLGQADSILELNPGLPQRVAGTQLFEPLPTGSQGALHQGAGFESGTGTQTQAVS